jgi:hypothetical protein
LPRLIGAAIEPGKGIAAILGFAGWTKEISGRDRDELTRYAYVIIRDV